MSEHFRESYRGSSLPDLRLVLLGNIGCGKTSSADTILGQQARATPDSAKSCQLRQGIAEGRRVTLVEAPRWYWSGGKMEDGVRKETERAATLLAPGPHAVLLLVPVSQFTEVEGRVPAELEEVFGEEVLDHTMVLLTCGDYLMGRTVEEYLQKEHPGLRQMIERCGGRYHVINNRQREDREQVQKLLERVEYMVQNKGEYHMKTIQERELEKRVKERKRELMESYRAQKEEKRKAFTSTQFTNIETIDGGEEYMDAWERRRTEEREMAGRVSASQVSNGLHSTPAAERPLYSSEPGDDRQVKRTPSFRLNADGALLSQLSEAQSPKRISTFHHRINSFEDRSPEVSPTSSPHSTVFSSSPTIASAPSVFSSSYSPTSSSTSFPSSSSTSFPSSSSSTSFPSSSTSTSFPSSSSTSTSFPSSSTSSSTSFPSSSTSTSFPSSSTSTSFPSSSSSTSSPSSSSSSSSDLRLVLLGRSGSGKSAAGNSILGREEFKSHPDSLTAITQECEKKKALVEGRRVAVLDTPDWFNSEKSPDEVRAQISSCVALSSPGPHAFLFCVPLDQPAKTEQQALKALEMVFGPDAVQRHTLIVFTHADRLRASGKAGDQSVEAYIAGQRGDLLKLVEKCGDRFHVMETGGGWRERKNVTELLEKVEQTVQEAGGQCYSCPAFQEAENKVRQRQVEIAKEKKSKTLERERFGEAGQLSSENQVLYSYMQPVNEAEEDVREDEIEKTRDEAEMSVSTMNIDSLPAVQLSNMSPSLLQAVMEKMGYSAKMLPKLLADGSVWVGEGAKKVRDSPVWGTVGSGAQNVQRRVADSAVWGKVGATAGNVSKAVGGRVPKVVVDGSAWVGSGAKAVAASPMWEKVGSGAKSGAKLMAESSTRVGAGIGTGAKNLAQSPMWSKVGSGARSGAKLMAESSMRVGAGIGTGAKNLAQSPMWSKVGSGARTGAKLVAENSMKVGAGIGAGAKKVAQSPVWGKMGAQAKTGAKMVAESPVWEKIGTTAKQVPVVVIVGAVLGLVLGVFLGGAIGGAVGAAAGSAATEVGRRQLGKKSTLEKTNEAARDVYNRVNNSVDSGVKQGEKLLKSE